jgi:hypothetical protein
MEQQVAEQLSERYYIPKEEAIQLGQIAVKDFFNHARSLQEEDAFHPSEYYTVLGSGLIFTGQVAIKGYLTDNGYPRSDQLLLSDALTSPKIEIDRYAPTDESWQKKKLNEFRSYGWMINSMVKTSAPDSVLNEKAIVRANYLGIGPSLHQIRQKFGSLGKYYKHLNLVDARRTNTFKNWKTRNAVEHIRYIGEQIGRRPNESDIDTFASIDTSYPTCDHLTGRFGPVRDLLEKAGYLVIHNWDIEDYINWGVEFIKQEGKAPSQNVLEELSPRGLSPSATQLRLRFNKLSQYQELIWEAFEDTLPMAKSDLASTRLLYRDLLETGLDLDARQTKKDLGPLGLPQKVKEKLTRAEARVVWGFGRGVPLDLLPRDYWWTSDYSLPRFGEEMLGDDF